MTSHDPSTTASTAGSPTHRIRRRAASVPNSLDIARTSFALLVTGPEPLSLDGRNFDGLPGQLLPLSLVRDQLLAASCPQATRDAVWAELVTRSRREGGAWTVGAVGVALPALTSVAARLTGRFAGDPAAGRRRPHPPSGPCRRSGRGDTRISCSPARSPTVRSAGSKRTSSARPDWRTSRLRTGPPRTARRRGRSTRCASAPSSTCSPICSTPTPRLNRSVSPTRSRSRRAAPLVAISKRRADQESA